MKKGDQFENGGRIFEVTKVFEDGKYSSRMVDVIKEVKKEFQEIKGVTNEEREVLEKRFLLTELEKENLESEIEESVKRNKADKEEIAELEKRIELIESEKENLKSELDRIFYEKLNIIEESVKRNEALGLIEKISLEKENKEVVEKSYEIIFKEKPNEKLTKDNLISNINEYFKKEE